MPRIVLIIFLLAVFIRFLYFPQNVNFAYDQARDSFASLQIFKGDFKIIGPPTTASDKIFHGALIYYILAPIYFIAGSSPEVAAAVFRVINAFGVFLVFYIAYLIFQKQVGILASFLFAVSFERSQYSLFFGHPALGDFTILLFYLGLALWIFKNKSIGFIIALLGLGLTIQFEDANGLLILSLLVFLLIFYRKLLLLNFKTIIFGILGFILAISTFILSEIKYNFRMSEVILSVVLNSSNGLSVNLGNILFVVRRFIHDNFIANQPLAPIFLITLIICILFMIQRKELRMKIIFLLIWFLGGMVPHLLNSSFTYYYSPGATVSLIILVSFLVYQLFLKQKILGIFLLGVIIVSNLFLVISQNYKGPNSDIVIQPGMLISEQKRTLDYIYTKAEGQQFAVNALTIPLSVKTTWDFLFDWYGKDKYGYLPVWGADAAEGFYGTLPVITDRSKLPNRRFTIIEPTVGIGQKQVEDFFREEDYFSKIVDEKIFGTIKVQERQRI